MIAFRIRIFRSTAQWGTTPRCSNTLWVLWVLGGAALAWLWACSAPPPADGNNNTTSGTTTTPPNVVSGGGSAQQGGAGVPPDVVGSAGTTPGAGGTPPQGSAGAVNTAGMTSAGGSSAAGAGMGGSGVAGAGGVPAECPAGVMGHPNCNAEYPSHDGFTLALVEEFDAPLDLDADPIWTWSDGGLDEGNVRFLKEQVVFENGVMKLVADTGPVPGSESHAEEKAVGEKPLKSGELRTKFNNFRYGRYETRMKVPTIAANPGLNGNFVATFFAFRTPKFQQWREIDIEVTGDSPNAVGTNLVVAENAFDYPGGTFETHTPAINARTEFHVYAFEWLPNSVRYFVDGQMVRNTTGQPRTPGAGLIPADSTKIIMNLWVFNDTCDFGGRECGNNAYPFWTEYDWVRFYKWDAETTYPCSPTPSCLPDTDLDGSKNNPTDGVPDIAPQ